MEEEWIRLKENLPELVYDETTREIFEEIFLDSLEIEELENEIETLLDETEKYLNFMSTGLFNLKIGKTIKLNSKIVRFNYKRIDLLKKIKKTTLKDIYIILINYFEINERIKSIEDKALQLKEISDYYILFSLFSKNRKRDFFLIALLAIFPIFRITELVINNIK